MKTAFIINSCNHLRVTKRKSPKTIKHSTLIKEYLLFLISSHTEKASNLTCVSCHPRFPIVAAGNELGHLIIWYGLVAHNHRDQLLSFIMVQKYD